jgi:hypothetical protein
MNLDEGTRPAALIGDPLLLKLKHLWQLTELRTSEPSIRWTRQHTLTYKTAERRLNAYNQIFPECMNHPTSYASPSGPWLGLEEVAEVD